MDTLQKGDKVEINTNDGKVIYDSLQSYLDLMYCGQGGNLLVHCKCFSFSLNINFAVKMVVRGHFSDHP